MLVDVRTLSKWLCSPRPRQGAAPFTGHRGSLCPAAPHPRASPAGETDRAAVAQDQPRHPQRQANTLHKGSRVAVWNVVCRGGP